jgi:exonuclease III
MKQEQGHGAPSVRIVLWNIAWRRRQSPAGRVIADIIQQHDPDIVCLTEAHTDFLPNGHLIHARADYGYPLKEGRRKVLLWSRQPWADIDDLGDERLPSGRFVAGTTETQFGPLRMIGVCVPWPAAHVATGRKDRRPWEDHLAYLQGLSDILARQDQAGRLGQKNDQPGQSCAQRLRHRHAECYACNQVGEQMAVIDM